MNETDGREATKRTTATWPFIVAIAALLLAIPHWWPYGYYQLLHFVVSGVAIYGAVQAHHRRRIAWLSLLVGMAVLFNPILPIHLPKNTWSILDFIIAGLLAIFAVTIRREPKSTQRSPYFRDILFLIWILAFYAFAFLLIYFQLYISDQLKPFLLDWVSEENVGGVAFLVVCVMFMLLLGLSEVIENWLSERRYQNKCRGEKIGNAATMRD